MPEEIMDYDPNLTCSGRMAKQTVRLTFAMWKYRKAMEVEVGGNCTGMNVIESALSTAYEQLPERGVYMSKKTYAVMDMPSLEDPEDVLEASEDDGGDRLRGEEWLKDLLICAEIIAIVPDVR